MDVTRKCNITGKFGFDTFNKNKFAIVEVRAKYGDTIKMNKINGIRYSKICAAFEYPEHMDNPIIDQNNSVLVVGGKEAESKRVLCVIGL